MSKYLFKYLFELVHNLEVPSREFAAAPGFWLCYFGTLSSYLRFSPGKGVSRGYSV